MSKVHDYIEIFNKAKGDNLAKVKYILAKCSDRWEWAGSNSIIADLMDDKYIAAEDIAEVLQSAVEMGEGNREFKAAATGIAIALKKTHRPQVDSVIDISEFNSDFGGNDYQSGSYYGGGFAEA